MKVEFKPEELVSKKGKTYPVVGGRLRVAHETNTKMDITTEMISYDACISAVVKAIAVTEKGPDTAYGAASVAKDERLLDSLLELAETRAIARALRFAGYGVEYTGSEELPIEDVGSKESSTLHPAAASKFQVIDTKADKPVASDKATPPQLNDIQKICARHHWNTLEAVHRILRNTSIQQVEDLTKSQARQVITRMKEALAA